MHEASIIMSILDTVCSQCVREGYEKITSIRLRIGKASNILPDALTFAFEIAQIDTIAHEADLLIESIPMGGYCKTCSHLFEFDKFIYKCPACQSTSIKIDKGFEMEIVDMEVD